MADVYQTGVVATFHRLNPGNLKQMESELEECGHHRPVALVLPSLYSELGRPALKKIVEELRQVRYLHRVVVCVDQATPEEFRRARKFFSVLPQKTTFIWTDGPSLKSLYTRLEESDLSVGSAGKGRSAWTAHGYILAEGDCDVIALHDCDILSYTRELLARLVYPVANPNLDYEFCKGFYARVTDRLHGRVTRLFFTPMVRSLKQMLGPIPLLDYLDSFRYALAGETAMDVDLARINRIPSDWGLEIGTLAEIFRNCALKRICQAELTANYEHKHQPLSADNPESGLLKMAIDISKSIFRTLGGEGVVMSDAFFKTLRVTYIRTGQDTISRYAGDAALNGLFFDRHAEDVAVEAFGKGIRLAGEDFLKAPLGAPLIPNWNRVTAAFPEFLEELKYAVLEDSQPS